MSILNSDIYNITEFIEDIKRDHIEVTEDNSLMMGINGYIGSLFSSTIQNLLIVAAENANEIHPTKAKFDKNILVHAMTAQIKNINAVPSRMEILIGINEKELLSNMKNDTFVIDSNSPILIGDFEFHLDYDIRIVKGALTNNTFGYIATYDLSNENILSDITNPYILPPLKLSVEGENFIFISTIIRQVEYTTSYNKIISDDNIENKSFEFSFESQLADFEIYCEYAGVTTRLHPVFEGMPLLDSDKKYCYYSYTKADSIRIRFIKSSYEPKLNTMITTKIKTTQGASGTFVYNEDVAVTPVSDKYQYNAMTLVVKPMGSSDYGVDKKSIQDLKDIIPKEILSRGSITCKKDLDNYFNMISDKNNKMKFLDKINNQNERAYYAFILLKDNLSNIIPSNTINLKMLESDFVSVDNRLILKPGTMLKYNSSIERSELDNTAYTQEQIKNLENTGFLYSSPLMMVITKSPMYVSFYLNILERSYKLLFSYINDRSLLQFISTKIKWTRRLTVDPNMYKIDMTVSQNINEEKNLVTLDAGGAILSSKLKIFAVFNNSNSQPIRYTEAQILAYDEEIKSYDFRISLTTDDTMDEDSNIKITNLFDPLTTTPSDCYLPINGCKVSLYIVAELDQEYGRLEELDSMVPNLAGYTLCNKYEINNGVNFVEDFTDIMSAKVTVKKNAPEDVDYWYEIDSVPALKYSYTQNESRIKYFIDYILMNKNYIKDALKVLEDSFGIDFKFFNTYGPSKIFKIGHSGQPLDRTNISLKFKMSIDITSDDSLKDFVIAEIKSYIEDLNNSLAGSIHMSKLVSYIMGKFPSIKFLEFVGINSYDTSYQNISLMVPEVFYVPEFLNVGSKDINYIPDIIIDVV